MNLPNVERPKIIRGSSGIYQDAPDQETGKNKKKIDATPAQPENRGKVIKEPKLRLVSAAVGHIVQQKYQQNGRSAQSIEFRPPLFSHRSVTLK